MALFSFNKSEKDKYLDEAKKYKRRGEFDRAGDYFFMGDAIEEALAMYVQGGHHLLAAKMLEKKGDLRRAAEQYLLARELRPAAVLFEKLKDLKRASQIYEKLGEHFRAAKLEEAGKSYRRAAELYLKAGHLDKASASYMREGEHLRAAETLEDHLRKPGLGLAKDQADAEWTSCAELYVKARRWAKAAEIWSRLGQSLRAAESYDWAGDPGRAIAMYLEADQVERASEAFQRAPQGTVDPATRAALLYAKQAWPEAADAFRELRNHARSAECYEKAGNPTRAAEQYQLSGDFEYAADLLFSAGEFARSSRLYEQGLRYLMAARAAVQAGELERAGEMFAQAHEPAEAARCFRQVNQADKAIALLQQMTPSDESYTEGTVLLGDLFRERGLHGIALEKYRIAIGERGVDEKTIDAYYGLARLQEDRGDVAAAQELYERVVATSYTFRDAAQRLEFLHRPGPAPAAATPAPPPAPAPAPRPAPVAAVERAPDRGSAAATALNEATVPLAREGPVVAATTGSIGSNTGATSGVFARRYEIVARIGSSDRGEIYKAWDVSLGRTVVLKRLLPAGNDDDSGQLRRYVHEAQQASKLHHANIATIYDAVDAPEGRFVATEYVFGTSLRELLSRQGKLAPARAVEIVSQILLGLEYAHGIGVTHRNLRPENVLLAESSHVKLTDFGLNRRYSDLAREAYRESSPLHYLSPEQLRGDRVDPRADIYAVGCLLYEMLIGRPPFGGANVGERHLNEKPVPPSQIDAEVPSSLDRLLLKCLEKEPGLRYASARHVYEELRSFDLMPGVRIADRYEIVRELGSGGMGKVFLARDLELDERIAMKVLRPEFGADPMIEQRFLREIKLARKIIHPSVVKVFDFGKWRNIKYITMEFIDGISLDEYVKRNRPLPIESLARFSIQIAEALEAAHRLGVIHRDIKPQNVLISSADQRARLVDFGIARVEDFEDLTSSRLIIGSPKYMSPEQISGKGVDPRTDVYSLGVVMYYCFTGVEPFLAEDTNGIIIKQLHEMPVPPSQINPAIPPWLEMVILKALMKDPRARYQRAAELAHEMSAHLR